MLFIYIPEVNVDLHGLVDCNLYVVLIRHRLVGTKFKEMVA